MTEYNLALIPGDGVGPEVVAEGKKILESISTLYPDLKFSYTEFS